MSHSAEEAAVVGRTNMIALSGGGHTVEFSHCGRFSDRLYPAAGGTVDPSLNPVYAWRLMNSCPREVVDPTVVVDLVSATPDLFDNAYFLNLEGDEGLLSSDEVLFTEPRSRAAVRGFAADQGSFFSAFLAAMVRLGRTGVKTGSQGEIRRDCTRFN